MCYCYTHITETSKTQKSSMLPYLKQATLDAPWPCSPLNLHEIKISSRLRHPKSIPHVFFPVSSISSICGDLQLLNHQKLMLESLNHLAKRPQAKTSRLPDIDSGGFARAGLMMSPAQSKPSEKKTSEKKCDMSSNFMFPHCQKP